MRNFLRRGAISVLVLMLGGIAYAGLESVTHIQDLNSSWPLGSDLASTSDDHIRNIKSALKTDFPNFNGTYTSASLPVFAIPSDTNTGIYSVAADDLGFSAGGTLRFDISTTAFTGTLPFLGQNGAVGNPAYSFSSDPDSGVYRIGANDVGVSAGGVLVMDLSQTQAAGRDGLAGSPGYAFISDPDTGMFRDGANTVALGAGGAAALEADGVAVYIAASHVLKNVDGTAANPTYTFGSDPDTGFYRDTANELAIALAGSTAGRFATGSFTGTLTGYAANPTGTVTWRKNGSNVTLYVTAAITGTSNATTLTMTGLPAAVQPAAAVEVPCSAVDNSNRLTATCSIAAAGSVITFIPYNSATFTNSGTKAINAGWQITYVFL